MRAGLEIPAAPFVEFLNARFADLERSENGSSAEALAEQLGWGASEAGVRRLNRHRNGLRAGSDDGAKGDFPTDTYPLAIVQDALEQIGQPIAELYPQLAAAEEVSLEAEVHCATCDEQTTPIEGICPWCETPVAVDSEASIEPQQQQMPALSDEAAATRLAELVETINEQTARIEAAAKVLVEHAVKIGDALLEAQQIVGPGGWVAWVEANVPFGRHRSMCKNYMRLAALKAYVDPELTITANLRMVTGLQRKCASVPRKPAEVKAEAVRLWHTGQFSYTQIGGMVGAAPKSVHAWVDPAYAEHVRRTTRRNEAGRRDRLRALPGAAETDRAQRYGTPGRAALSQAVRKLAKAATGPYIIEALLDIEAIAAAWRDRLEERRAA